MIMSSLNLFLTVFALLGAFGGACLGIFCLLSNMSFRGNRTSSEPGGTSTFLAWRFRNGFRIFLKPSRVLLKLAWMNNFVQRSVRYLGSRGLVSTSEAFLSVVFFLLLVVFAVVSILSRSLICACAAPACVAAVFLVVLNSYEDKLREQSLDALPDCLHSMISCFQSGFSLLQTLQQVAKETNGPLKGEFEQAAHRLELGYSASDALKVFHECKLAPELSFVAVAMDIHHLSGGGIVPVLEAARLSIEGEIALKRSLRVQTAQAQLSARIVSIMPLILVALLSLFSEGFLSPFFGSYLGVCTLVLAVVMQVSGIVIVRRMLEVEVS